MLKSKFRPSRGIAVLCGIVLGSFLLSSVSASEQCRPRPTLKTSSPSSHVKSLMRYPYGQWPGYQPTFRLFGRSLTLGGKLETELDYRKDLELRKEAEDDRLRLDQELQLEFFYRLASRVSLWRRLTPLES